jgi:IclR family transcriptional regulator, KDG regulon repressor
MSTIRVSHEGAGDETLAQAPSGSLPKGLALLELLSSNEGPMGITALAKRMHMPKSGVHRLLQVLRDSGWVRQTLTGEYECTMKLWELGQRLASKIDLRRAAMPAMRELAARTRETILLSVLDGSEVLYLEVLDSPQPVRVHTNPGDRAPASCMATGKALLAYAPASVIDSAARDLHTFTARTITTRAELDRELEGVRRRGFAVSHGEWNEGVKGIAAPLFDSSGQAVAAISIGAPSERMSDVVVDELAPLVVKAAQLVSRELGCPSRE